MSFDNHANLAVSTIATQPSPATSGTSLVVASGDGAIFPAAPFNATIWPADETPTLANAEIIRVTGKSTDTLTIVRAQEGTTARVVGAGDQICATVTAKMLTDIETASWPESQLSTSDVTTANVSSSKHGFAPKSPADAAKFLNGGATPGYAQVKDSDLSTTDITTNDVSTSKHGFTPKAPADSTKFLRGDATWAVPSLGSVTESDISLSDVTTDNVSITKHGFAPKAPNDATKYLDGSGAYSIPAGTGSGVSSVDGIAGSVSLVAGSHITISDNTPSAGDITIAASGAAAGSSELVYRYTVAGSDKASIDTGSDTADAGSTSWTNGDLLEIFMVLRTDDAGAQASVNVTLNNDTGSNYDVQVFSAANTVVAGAGAVAGTPWGLTVHGSGGTANYASVFRFVCPDYAGTTFYKVLDFWAGVNDGTAGNERSEVDAFGYRSTSALTRVKVAAQGGAKLKIGSQVLVYKRLAS